MRFSGPNFSKLIAGCLGFAVHEEPLVSITVCVHNGEKFLKETIDGILAQTYRNWELIIVDDASKDNSLKIINEYAQKNDRIKVIANPRNLGMSANRNVALRHAKGKYIAIHDHDDISLPRRIEKQVGFFENDKKQEYVICGTGAVIFGEVNTVSILPSEHLREFQMASCVFFHSSVMFRRDYLERNNLFFDESLSLVDDHEFQYRVLNLEKKKGHNIPQHLVKFRFHSTSNGKGTNHEKILQMCRELRLMQFRQLVGRELSKAETALLDLIFFRYKYSEDPTFENLKEVHSFFKKMRKTNLINNEFDDKGLKVFFGFTLNELFLKVRNWDFRSLLWYLRSFVWKDYLRYNSIWDLLYLFKKHYFAP